MPAPGLQSNSFDDLEDIMTPWPEDDGSLQVIVETSEDEAAPRLDPRTGAMEIPMPDGSVIIDLNPASKFGDGDEFSANLADYLPEYELSTIATSLLEGIGQDDDSRKQWLQDRAKGLDLLGLKIDSPKADVGSSAAPLEGMSTVRHPLLLEAVLRFQANAFGELCPADGPAKVVNYGDQTFVNDQLAESLERDFNYYLTTTAKEYYPGTDRMLWWVGFGGMMFKKVYNCPLKRRPVSEMVDAKDVIVSNYVPDLESAGRITHEITMRQSVMKRMQFLGVYRDVELGLPNEEADAVDRKIASVQGVKPISDRPEDQDYQLFECYCELDLPGFEDVDPETEEPTGIALPYRVTIEKNSRQILEIRRNWDEDDEQQNAKIPFTAFEFVRGMGFYAIGLLHILGNTTNAITAAWREMLDAGMFANFPGFLYAKSSGRQVSNEFRIPPGGGAQVDTGGMDIRQAIMPLPYKEAGPGLMSLTEHIAQTGQRLGGTADTPVGEGVANAPVGTTLALIEQATKIESAVHKRLHQAQAKELQLLVDLFRQDPQALWRQNKRCALKKNTQLTLMALENCDIVPQSDPNVPSRMHRLAKVATLGQIAMAAPGVLDAQKVVLLQLKEIGIDNPDQLLAPPQAGAQPDPIKMAELAIKGKKVNIDEMKAISGVQNEAANRRSKEQLAILELAERIATHPESYALVQQTLSGMPQTPRSGGGRTYN